MAYAITIHKSEGLTIPIAKMDLGNKEFALGPTYVLIPGPSMKVLIPRL